MLQRLRDGRQGLLAAAASDTGLSYARTRSLLLKKRLRDHDDDDEASWWYYPILQLRQFSREKLPFTLPVKAGIAAVIGSLLCFAPGFLSVFNKNGMWAVITIDIVMETNVGLTFSKGNQISHLSCISSLIRIASEFESLHTTVTSIMCFSGAIMYFVVDISSILHMYCGFTV